MWTIKIKYIKNIPVDIVSFPYFIRGTGNIRIFSSIKHTTGNAYRDLLSKTAKSRFSDRMSCIEHASVIEAGWHPGHRDMRKKKMRESHPGSLVAERAEMQLRCVCTCVTKVISHGCAKAARRHALWSRINNRQSRNPLSPAELQNIIDERYKCEILTGHRAGLSLRAR